MSRSAPHRGIDASRIGRRLRLRRGTAVLLVLPLLLGLLSPLPASGDDLSEALARQRALAARVKAQRQQVARLNAMQADLRGEIASTQAALKQVNADLATVRTQVRRATARVREARATYLDLVAQVNALQRDLLGVLEAQDEKRNELRERKALLARRLRMAYETGQTSILETLLSSRSFTEVLSDVASYLDIGRQDRALVEQIQQDQETLATLKDTVQAARDGTAELRAAAMEQKQELDARLADLREAQGQLKKLERETARQLAVQRSAFAKMASNAAAVKRALARDLAAQNDLKRQIDAMVARQRRGGGIPSAFSGTLDWPLNGIVTQNFGCTGFAWEPPLGNCAHFHRGIDIAAPMYRPIRAAGAGVVVFAGPNPYDSYPKAWIVIIAHSDNLLTWYGHVDNAVRPPAVRAGERVAKGEIIAYVGMTGHTTGPHLHWMVEFNDDFVNPRLFL